MRRIKGKDLLRIRDLDFEEIMQIIETALDLKKDLYMGKVMDVLKGKTLAMIFQKPSLRTRMAFETAMTQLGGHAIYLGPDDIKLGKREDIDDIAEVLSRMADVIMARVFEHEVVEILAKNSRVSVINGLSDFEHPTQALGDLLTIYEKRGTFDKVTVAFVGDGNNVSRSLMYACVMVGMNFRMAVPRGYELDEESVEEAKMIAKRTGAEIFFSDDPKEVVKDADVVYTDVWTSMGQESEAEERRRAFEKYRVDMELMGLAKENAIFMHCLPAHYGEEVTKEVSRSKNSVIFDQAENRLHSIKALLVHMTP